MPEQTRRIDAEIGTVEEIVFLAKGTCVYGVDNAILTFASEAQAATFQIENGLDDMPVLKRQGRIHDVKSRILRMDISLFAANISRRSIKEIVIFDKNKPISEWARKKIIQ